MSNRTIALLIGAAGVLTATGANLGARQAPAGQAPPPPTPTVKVGDPAPDFTLAYIVSTAEGKFETKQVKLSDHKGRSVVVLAFFPAAFSPG